MTYGLNRLKQLPLCTTTQGGSGETENPPFINEDPPYMGAPGGIYKFILEEDLTPANAFTGVDAKLFPIHSLGGGSITGKVRDFFGIGFKGKKDTPGVAIVVVQELPNSEDETNSALRAPVRERFFAIVNMRCPSDSSQT